MLSFCFVSHSFFTKAAVASQHRPAYLRRSTPTLSLIGVLQGYARSCPKCRAVLGQREGCLHSQGFAAQAAKEEKKPFLPGLLGAVALPAPAGDGGDGDKRPKCARSSPRKRWGRGLPGSGQAGEGQKSGSPGRADAGHVPRKG